MGDRQARAVNNKDIALIQDIPGIRAEIESLEQRRKWERERMRSITQHLSQTNGGGGYPKGLDDAFARLAETEERQKQMIKNYTMQLRRAEAIIIGIPSAQMRAMVTMLYLDGLSAGTVREKLGMTRWTFENCRYTIESAERMADVKWHDR